MASSNRANAEIDPDEALDDFERRVRSRSNWSWTEVLDLIERLRKAEADRDLYRTMLAFERADSNEV